VEKHHPHEVPYPPVDAKIHVVQPQNFTFEVEGEEPFKLHEEIIIVMQSKEHKLEFDEYVIVGTMFTTVVIDNNRFSLLWSNHRIVGTNCSIRTSIGCGCTNVDKFFNFIFFNIVLVYY
jgi:hypothetical protein